MTKLGTTRSWAERLGFIGMLGLPGIGAYSPGFSSLRMSKYRPPLKPNPEVEAAAEAKRLRRCARNLHEAKQRKIGTIMSLYDLYMHIDAK